MLKLPTELIAPIGVYDDLNPEAVINCKDGEVTINPDGSIISDCSDGEGKP